MAPYTRDRFRGGRPSTARVETHKKSAPDENPVHRIRAGEYNPDGHEWIYKGVRVMLHRH